jgi:hypothetical protein
MHRHGMHAAGLFCAAVAVFLGACGKAPTGEAPLVVGMDLSYPPFEMIDAPGRPAGVSVANRRTDTAAPVAPPSAAHGLLSRGGLTSVRFRG